MTEKKKQIKKTKKTPKKPLEKEKSEKGMSVSDLPGIDLLLLRN